MIKKNRKSSKESASNLFNRYVWLVDIIFRTGQITFEEINERWVRSDLNHSGDDFPIKTFHNHRKAIEQMFDINIECNRKAGYIYYIENSDDVERGGVRSWLLNTFAVNNLINESHKLKHRILFENIPSGQKYLTQIIEAMRDGKIIEMTYQSFWRDKPTTFKIEPYCVKIFKRRWYVVAKNSAYDAPRIYSLDRIFNIRTTDTEFILPIDFDAQSYFHNCFGIIVNESIDVQAVKVFGNQVKYFRALALHHSQNEKEKGEDYSVFEYYLRPTFDFRQELLSHGSEIEIISPQWLRSEISNITKSMTKMYASAINDDDFTNVKMR